MAETTSFTDSTLSLSAQNRRASPAFNTTRWSLVQHLKGEDEFAANCALEQLCQSYWFPIYAFIRRSGKSPHDAEDLTQGFFVKLLHKEVFAEADPQKGRLRSFLLTCLRHHLADEHDRRSAAKRGAKLLVHFDPASAEGRYAAEPSDDLSPDRLFQRRWALNILEASVRLLAAEHETQGKSELFRAIRPFLGFQTAPAERYEEVAARLDMPAGTLKSHVSRLRDRWHKLLFQEVARTLDDPSTENIRAELAELKGCL